MGFDWTEERTARLKELHAQDYSFSQIAADLGDGVSRNACIGKALRIGLPKRNKSPGRGLKPVRKPRNIKTIPVKRLIRASANSNTLRIIETVKIVQEEPVSDLPASEIPIEQRKTLLQLGCNDCRWPYGDPGTPEFFFCGGEKAKGCSYCARHQRISLNKPLARDLSPAERQRLSTAALEAHDRKRRLNDWMAA